MTEELTLRGPFYVELVFEQAGDSEQIAAAYVDGFNSEADAFDACKTMRNEPIEALDKEGGDITVAPEQLIQMLIAKRSFNEAA